MKLSTKATTPPPREEARKVHFAEHEDIFIIREDGDDEISIMGMSSSEQGKAEEEANDDEEEEEEEESSFQESVVDIQKNMRECVRKWSDTPYWKLLEASVDDEDGEAKDVQKYITSFARVEVNDDTPRGLERQISRDHHEARKALADCANHAVLSCDFRFRYESRTKASDDDIWKELRRIYKKHSHGAARFARKMGKADEAAIQRDTISEEQAIEYIKELQERLKSGALRVQRCSSMSQVKRRSSKGKERVLTKANSVTMPRSKSAELLSSGGGSDHTTSSSSSPKKIKRRSLFRKVPSLSSMKSTSRDFMKEDMNNNNDEDEAEEQPAMNDGSHADDLFHEVDKKGKTKRSSRWGSLKRKFSKKSPSERTPRTQ